MAISMRHTKLTAQEAAILAGELKKPNWQSKNEGIHERVSFEDTIWGFDLAGGSFYKTPLRVTFVKKDSRAEKAGIRPGDKLLRINDIDTSTLTIQEAHEIILESGIHLKIAVTAPEDEEDAYFCYEDELQNAADEEERRRLAEEEKNRKRIVHAKVSSYWSLQWPWVSKRRVIYRESNCFMVPSKYEGKHKEKFPDQPFLRVEDDIVLHNKNNSGEDFQKTIDDIAKMNTVANGVDQIANGVDSESNKLNSVPNGADPMINTELPVINGENQETNKAVDGKSIDQIDDQVKETNQINDVTADSEIAEGNTNNEEKLGEEMATEEVEEEVEEEIEEEIEEEMEEEINEEEEVVKGKHTDDEVIDQVLDSQDTMAKDDEDRILDGILSSTDAHSPENSTSNER